MDLAELILARFRGREDVVAVQNGKAFAPQEIGGPLPPRWLNERHLNGSRCLGFYVMRTDNCVWCSCVDFDNKPDNPDPEWRTKTENLYHFLCTAGLSPVVEISSSGQAAHVWLFFDEPAEAWAVRGFWKACSEKSDIPFVEVYPRQDELSGKGLGNLVRYPLWANSRFVDVENEWVEIDPIAALSSVESTDDARLRHIAWNWGHELRKETCSTGVDVETGLPHRVKHLLFNQGGLLAIRWTGETVGLADKSLSAVALSICGELVRKFVPTHDIHTALKVWCELHGYEKGQRDDWIARTVEKAYENPLGREQKQSAESTTLEVAVNEFIDFLATDEDPRIRSGIRGLDESIDGIAPGEVCVIGARPSNGKSTVGLQWMDSAAAWGYECLLISEEMSNRELATRSMLYISEISQDMWRENDSVRERLREEARDHFELRSKVHIVQNCNTIERVEDVVEEYVAVHGVKFVAVDYLQLLTSSRSSRYEDVSEVSRRIKQLAKRNNVAMLVLCQLSRDVEKRENSEPRLSDLRESGQIEQDADIVLFCRHMEKFDANADPKEYVIWAAKHRNGHIKRPRIMCEFDKFRQRVT